MRRMIDCRRSLSAVRGFVYFAGKHHMLLSWHARHLPCAAPSYGDPLRRSRLDSFTPTDIVTDALRVPLREPLAAGCLLGRELR
jgi:hypothetical protein